MTISLHEHGLMLGGQEIPYAEIASLTVHDKRRYDETATVRVLTRTITIEAAGRKVKAVYVVRPAEALDHLLDHRPQTPPPPLRPAPRPPLRPRLPDAPPRRQLLLEQRMPREMAVDEKTA